MLDRSRIKLTASVPATEEAPGLSRRGFLEMSAAAAFLFGFCVPLRTTRPRPPRPLRRMPS